MDGGRCVSRLKRAEETLRRYGGKLAQLEVAKRQAVASEDYDRAKLIKGEADALRHQVRRVGCGVAPREPRLTRPFRTSCAVQAWGVAREPTPNVYIYRQLRAVGAEAKPRMPSHPKSDRSRVQFTEIYRKKAPVRAVSLTYRNDPYDPNLDNAD